MRFLSIVLTSIAIQMNAPPSVMVGVLLRKPIIIIMPAMQQMVIGWPTRLINLKKPRDDGGSLAIRRVEASSNVLTLLITTSLTLSSMRRVIKDNPTQGVVQ